MVSDLSALHRGRNPGIVPPAGKSCPDDDSDRIPLALYRKRQKRPNWRRGKWDGFTEVKILFRTPTALPPGSLNLIIQEITLQ